MRIRYVQLGVGDLVVDIRYPQPTRRVNSVARLDNAAWLVGVKVPSPAVEGLRKVRTGRGE